ncbi:MULTISPECIES: hypothetical protein [unclassified Microbacterium]|uniref:hypothetical protein n=1 Tax=unclassified Microbacterium TaxID=2609290 RepID=UPI00301B18D7
MTLRDDLARVAAALEETVEEMHARELHHFEEEKLRAEAEAERDALWAAIREATEYIESDAGISLAPMMPGRIIYDDPKAVFVEVLTEGIGYERVVGQVRRHHADRTVRCICADMLPEGAEPRPCPQHGWMGEGAVRTIGASDE